MSLIRSIRLITGNIENISCGDWGEGESKVTKIKKTVFKQRVEITSCSAINIANDLIKLNLEEMKDSFA